LLAQRETYLKIGNGKNSFEKIKLKRKIYFIEEPERLLDLEVSFKNGQSYDLLMDRIGGNHG